MILCPLPCDKWRRGLRRPRYANAQDQFVELQRGFNVGGSTRLPVQIFKRDRSLPLRDRGHQPGVEGGEGDRQVARINGDARLATAEQSVTTV